MREAGLQLYNNRKEGGTCLIENRTMYHEQKAEMEKEF